MAIFCQYRKTSIQQITQSVSQRAVVAFGEASIGPVSVRANVQLAHHIKPEGVDAPLIDYRHRINRIAGAFTDLYPIFLPPTMHHDLFGKGNFHGLEHDGPIDAVKLNDIFSYQVIVSRPDSQRRIDHGFVTQRLANGWISQRRWD